ncbi:hypothetical protein ECC02_008746 [Trypanosoma cruzi]|uniref:Uncharacterized protein n=1 Tax=Trypanosoma cruzi TaxID=5693 RepID=A0A7J6XVW3_TRYCR|nr:hypothetical protein ECC02_008746 [Trypanosoma cruzi]
MKKRKIDHFLDFRDYVHFLSFYRWHFLHQLYPLLPIPYSVHLYLILRAPVLPLLLLLDLQHRLLHQAFHRPKSYRPISCQVMIPQMLPVDLHSILVHPPPQPPLLIPFEWLTTRSPPLETRRHLHHYSCASNRSLHPHRSNRPSRVQKSHRTTARRGHTPAAHGQSSSSPSLLSVACSLQHKLTTRQRKAEATKEKPQLHHTQPPHSNKRQQLAHTIEEMESVQLQKHTAPQIRSYKKQKNKPRAPLRMHMVVSGMRSTWQMWEKRGAHSRAAEASKAKNNHQ